MPIHTGDPLGLGNIGLTLGAASAGVCVFLAHTYSSHVVSKVELMPGLKRVNIAVHNLLGNEVDNFINIDDINDSTERNQGDRRHMYVTYEGKTGPFKFLLLDREGIWHDFDLASEIVDGRVKSHTLRKRMKKLKRR